MSDHVSPFVHLIRQGSTTGCGCMCWWDLADWLRHQIRGLRALERAEKLAAAQTEELRVARNRLANAEQTARATIALLGIGDTRGADTQARATLSYLTFELED